MDNNEIKEYENVDKVIEQNDEIDESKVNFTKESAHRIWSMLMRVGNKTKTKGVEDDNNK